MKKNVLALALTVMLSVGLLSAAPASGAAPAFTPAATGEWIITYNVGSGADVFTRAVIQALMATKITPANLPVVAKPEGSGVIGMHYVANLSDQKQVDNTLVTLGGGDLTEAAEIAGFDPKSLQPIAVMSAEIPILSHSKNGKYKTFTDAVEAMKNGTQVVFGGPQNNYQLMAEALRDELGLTESVFTYIPYTSGKEGLTALMGNHLDFALSTPSHASELIAAGDVTPLWVYNDKHFEFGNLVDVPTFKEYMNGEYKDLKWAIYRIVAASGKMSPNAVAYWTDCMKQVTESKSWEDYCATFSLVTNFLTGDAARAMM
jgi:putative tricarboxylic transport membrane protein